MSNRNARKWIHGGARALGVWIAIASTVLLLRSTPASAQNSLVLPRPGQVGFSLQGQYGAFLNSGNLGDPFGNGGGIAVRMRYRMRYERAIGLSFESQSFDARSPADSMFARTTLHMLLTGADFYQLFNTQNRVQTMLSVGAGIAQIRYTLHDGETEFPTEGDGLYVSAGAGMERFFYRSLAFDLSGRYLAVFEGGKANSEFQAGLGLIFYASY
jgi:hypothetical protein